MIKDCSICWMSKPTVYMLLNTSILETYSCINFKYIIECKLYIVLSTDTKTKLYVHEVVHWIVLVNNDTVMDEVLFFKKSHYIFPCLKVYKIFYDFNNTGNKILIYHICTHKKKTIFWIDLFDFKPNNA